MTTTPSDQPAGVPAQVPAGLPAGARFDPITGEDLRSGGAQRRESFALQPGEPVNSFNLVTSLMPLASGTAPQTYRWALGLAALVPVIAGALGFLAFAFVAAAVVVPAIYIVYMYDVNEWEDQPIGVVLGAVGVAAATGVGFTFLWHAGILGDRTATAIGNEGGVSVDWRSLLVLVLLVPIGTLVLAQLGPLLLAARPQFDDMIDALTFGVAAGAAFAAAETIVVNRALFSSFGSIDEVNAGFWVSLILSAAIVKPIVYGAAIGIAVAAFSGIGSGYTGFKPAYGRGAGEALLALVAFQAGLYLSSRIDGTTGAMVGLVWGAIVAAALVVRLRYLLHYAVLEAALEGVRTGVAHKDAATGTAYCPACEMPLSQGANFCVACGTTTRAGSKVTRIRNRSEDAPDSGPTLKAAAAGVAPRDNKQTALVVGAVLAAVLVAGAIGQGVAAAAAENEDLPTDSGLEVVPDVGSGPVTEDAPDPAPAPGPEPDPSVSPDESTESSSRSGSGSGVVVHEAAFTSAAIVGGTVRSDDEGGPGGVITDEQTQDGTGTDDGTGGGIGTQTTGTGIDIGNGVGFNLPDGWEVLESEPGFAIVGTAGGTFSLQSIAGPVDVAALVPAHMQAIANGGLQELEYTDPESLALPTSSVVTFARVFYRGVYASQQNGAIPIDGTAFYVVTQDGTGYIADARAAQGLLDEGSPLLPGLNAMLNDFVGSL